MPTSERASSNDKAHTRTQEAATSQHEVSSSALRAGFRSEMVSPSDVLALQRTMGNRSVQRRVEEQIQRKSQPIQSKQNDTGIPDNVKAGIENLSGYSMDDLNVYYNSDKPAQLQAHAYAQGDEIHVASGQEKHLPHEAWQVAQQKQGRVRPLVQRKEQAELHDDAYLEQEADVIVASSQQV